jgi:hypothetical protein
MYKVGMCFPSRKKKFPAGVMPLGMKETVDALKKSNDFISVGKMLAHNHITQGY